MPLNDVVWNDFGCMKKGVSEIKGQCMEMQGHELDNMKWNTMAKQTQVSQTFNLSISNRGDCHQFNNSISRGQGISDHTLTHGIHIRIVPLTEMPKTSPVAKLKTPWKQPRLPGPISTSGKNPWRPLAPKPGKIQVNPRVWGGPKDIPSGIHDHISCNEEHRHFHIRKYVDSLKSGSIRDFTGVYIFLVPQRGFQPPTTPTQPPVWIASHVDSVEHIAGRSSRGPLSSPRGAVTGVLVVSLAARRCWAM